MWCDLTMEQIDQLAQDNCDTSTVVHRRISDESVEAIKSQPEYEHSVVEDVKLYRYEMGHWPKRQ